MQKVLLLFALSCFMLLSIPWQPCAQAMDATDLIYMTENARPFNWEDDDEVKGFSVALLKLMWEHMGVEPQEIALLPWARAYSNLQREINAVLFTTSRTPHRENLFKWVGPIKVTRYSLVARKDRKIRIDSLEQAEQYNVGTIRDDVAEQLLKNKKFPREKLQPGTDIQNNINKLNANRIDMITFNEESMFNWIQKMGFNRDDYEVVFLIQETPVCYAFNKSVPDALVAEFQKALDSILNTKAYKSLHREYFGYSVVK